MFCFVFVLVTASTWNPVSHCNMLGRCLLFVQDCSSPAFSGSFVSSPLQRIRCISSWLPQQPLALTYFYVLDISCLTPWIPFHPVLISQDCCNKLIQTSWLITTDIYCLSYRSHVGQGNNGQWHNVFKNVIQELLETELLMVLHKIVDSSVPNHTSLRL